MTHSSNFLFVGGMNSHSMGYSGSTVPQSHPHSSIPVHPDVQFKHTPFYDKLAELLKPSSLGMSPQILKLYNLPHTPLTSSSTANITVMH